MACPPVPLAGEGVCPWSNSQAFQQRGRAEDEPQRGSALIFPCREGASWARPPWVPLAGEGGESPWSNSPGGIPARGRGLKISGGGSAPILPAGRGVMARPRPPPGPVRGVCPPSNLPGIPARGRGLKTALVRALPPHPLGREGGLARPLSPLAGEGVCPVQLLGIPAEGGLEDTSEGLALSLPPGGASRPAPDLPGR